jgi:hypothetical protein
MIMVSFSETQSPLKIIKDKKNFTIYGKTINDLTLFSETFCEQIIHLIENANKENYLYNKLKYE